MPEPSIAGGDRPAPEARQEVSATAASLAAPRLTPPGTGERAGWALPILLAVAVLGVGYLLFVRGGDPQHKPPATPPSAAAVDLSSLPVSNTRATIKAAPQDSEPRRAPSGAKNGRTVVVHPTRAAPVFDVPGGTAFAKVKPREYGDLWLPVIGRSDVMKGEEGGWVRVMLPSRPNRSTGWLRLGDGLQEAYTRHLVRIDLGSRRLELLKDGQLVGSWPVAIGAPATPTPVGRTFILGQFVDEGQKFSPVILPLGTHSKTLDSYGGGPGTVALHGWRDTSVFGEAVSHGCVRVPDDALRALRVVPLGTPVLIDRA